MSLRLRAFVLLAVAAGCTDGAPRGQAAAEAFLRLIPQCGPGGGQDLLDVLAEAPGRDSDGYVPLGPAGRAALEDAVHGAANLDAQQASDGAAAAGYDLCAYPGPGIALWIPSDRALGRARFAVRVLGARPLVVEAPHPVFDNDTLTEAVDFFSGLDARAVLVSGTHRCANPTPSGCSGTSSACEPSEPYRESDAAHEVDSAFQAAHRALAEAWSADWVMSVHGMGGAGASLSDGTTDPAPLASPVALVTESLRAEFPAEYITSCNPYPGAVVDARLCGTTNVQGRHVNGSPAPCTVGAPGSADRFVHLEQSPVLRSQAGRVMAAIDAVLP